jgi:hypothetical protein
MSKATASFTTRSPRQNPDADLRAMIERHGELAREMDRLIVVGGDDATDSPEYQAASKEALDLEIIIAVWPAETTNGEEARLRFMRMHPDFVDCCDVETLLETIQKLNAKRIAAGKAGRRHRDDISTTRPHADLCQPQQQGPPLLAGLFHSRCREKVRRDYHL